MRRKVVRTMTKTVQVTNVQVGALLRSVAQTIQLIADMLDPKVTK